MSHVISKDELMTNTWQLIGTTIDSLVKYDENKGA